MNIQTKKNATIYSLYRGRISTAGAAAAGARPSAVKIMTGKLHNLFNKLIHLPFMSLFQYYIQLGAPARGVTDGRGLSCHVIASLKRFTCV